jgi:tungstate transport system substrate-binding protein
MAARRLSVALTLLCGFAAGIAASSAEDRAIVLASTTSTQDSGLLDYLLPIFTAKTGIEVAVIARRTDEVLDGARRGEADVVLMHARPQEEKFVADGFGAKRFDVMYNDFVLIGPKSDPAGVKGKDIATALKAIEAKGAPFVSRGDRSGTHAAELALWIVAGIDIAGAKGAWYREIGQGMAVALEAARTANAYVLSDRGAWIAFKDRGDLDVVVEGDKRLLNQYGVMLLNPEKHPNVKKELGQTFVDWLISPEGQAAIAGYKVDGQQVFFPNADKPGG